MSSQRKIILNRPAQGLLPLLLLPPGLGEGVPARVLNGVLLLPPIPVPLPAGVELALTGKTSGASLQYWAKRRTAGGAVARSRRASAVSYIRSGVQ